MKNYTERTNPNDIANIEDAGGGAQFDNKTIVKGTDNKYKTAVGGYALDREDLFADTYTVTEEGTNQFTFAAKTSRAITLGENFNATVVGPGLSVETTCAVVDKGKGKQLKFNDSTLDELTIFIDFPNALEVTVHCAVMKLPLGDYSLTLVSGGGYSKIDNNYIDIDGSTITVNAEGKLEASGGSSLTAGSGIKIKDGEVSVNFGGNYDVEDSATVFENKTLTKLTNDLYEINETIGQTIIEDEFYHANYSILGSSDDVYNTAHTETKVIDGVITTCNSIYITSVGVTRVYLVQVLEGTYIDKICVLFEENTSELPITTSDVCSLFTASKDIEYIKADVIPVDGLTILRNSAGDIYADVPETYLKDASVDGNKLTIQKNDGTEVEFTSSSAINDNKTIVKNVHDELTTAIGGWTEKGTLYYYGQGNAKGTETSITLSDSVLLKIEDGKTIPVIATTEVGSVYGNYSVEKDGSGILFVLLDDELERYVISFGDGQVGQKVSVSKDDGTTIGAGNYEITLGQEEDTYHPIDNKFLKLDPGTMGVNSDGELYCSVSGEEYSEGSGISITNNKISTNFGGNYVLEDGAGLFDDKVVTKVSKDFYSINDVTSILAPGTNYRIRGHIADIDVNVVASAEENSRTVDGVSVNSVSVYIQDIKDAPAYLILPLEGAHQNVLGILFENITAEVDVAATKVSVNEMNENISTVKAGVIPVDNVTTVVANGVVKANIPNEYLKKAELDSTTNTLKITDNNENEIDVVIPKRILCEITNTVVSGSTSTLDTPEIWDSNAEYKQYFDVEISNMKEGMSELDMCYPTSIQDKIAPYTQPQDGKLRLFFTNATTSVDFSIISALYEKIGA